MKTTPLTTSFLKSKGNSIEIDQFANPKNQGKSWISIGETLQKELKCWVYLAEIGHKWNDQL